MKRVTIKDVAEELSISISTVSRALNNEPNIRLETREAVMAAAKRMGYRPNPVATNLKFGRSNTVGVIVPEMVTPYASRVIAGIQEVLCPAGIKVIIADSNESWERERENLAMMERFMVDGIIICLCDYKQNCDEYERLQRSGMPIIFYDRIPHDMEFSQVIVDDYIKSFFMVEHLIRSGCRKIVHIKGPDYLYNTHERAKGYRDAMRKFGVEDSAIQMDGLSFDDGAAAVDELYREGVEFDAIFAFTDTLAIGALNRLREKGVSIPGEVAIASFSGTVLATIVHPQLTSVEPPLFDMGREAATLMLEKIKDPKSPTRSIVLDANITLRESTIND